MTDGGDRIPLARPATGEGEIAAAARAIGSGRLVLGPEVERFEGRLARACGRAHAVAVSSGTAALELALGAAGIGSGDRVLLPAFGFPAAAHAALRAGAEIAAVDVSRETWNLDAGAAEALAAGARALVSIDAFGLVADAAPLEELCRRTGMVLIDDAACALGGHDAAGVPGGGYGVCATLSFHPRKIVTTGEGGAVLCDDAEMVEALRRVRNHGQGGRGRFVEVGTNARLSEIAAAIGACQLDRLEAMRAERRMLAEGYRQRLAPLRDRGRISWQREPTGAMHAYQTFAVLLAEGLDRDAVIQRMDAAGIETGPATYALHRVASVAGRLAPGPAPAVADALHDRGLALPLYVGMRSAQLDRVAETLAEVIA